MFFTGADACFQGEAPAARVEGWNCNPNYYGDGRNCDCGCGVADPDCEGAGVLAPGDGVGVEGCEICYDPTGHPYGGFFAEDNCVELDLP